MASSIMGFGEFMCLQCILLMLSLSVVVTEKSSLNYVVTGELPEGEYETLLKFGNLIARETSAVTSTGTSGVTLMLRQLSQGPDMLQLVYKIRKKNGQRKYSLILCEQLEDSYLANDFRSKFNRQLNKLGLRLEVSGKGNRTFSHRVRNDEQNDGDISEEDYIDTGDFERPDKIDLDSRLEDLRNVTVRILDSHILSGDLKALMDFKRQEKKCIRLNERLEKNIRNRVSSAAAKANQTHTSRVRREVFPMGIVPGTYWCGMDTVATRQSPIGAHVGTDVCCRQHDHCPIIISALTTQFGVFNYRMYTISHCSCDESLRRRRRREIGGKDYTSLFRMPGSKWCGLGYSAKDARELGGYTGADRCCRFHDLKCPFFIEGFSEKYGLRNWRMYTMMECDCDERFRSCLKQTNTGAADFVGKLFFNIIQTKCFDLKREATCTKTTWWGKCLKTEYKKQAHLRNPRPY